MGKRQIDQIIKQYIARLNSQFQSLRVILHGSYASGKYRLGESDIDLLVISKDFSKMSEDERFDILYQKTVGLPLDWHLYGFAPKEIRDVSPLNALSQMLSNGKVLIDKL